MPRSSEKERESAIARIERFLQPVFADPRDGRPLSIIAVARALHISPRTIRKYGLDERIKAAERFRSKSQKGEKKQTEMEVKLRGAKMEAQEWRERFERLLEVHTRVEYHLRQHPELDVDAILETPMPKPIRSAPRTNSARGNWRPR